MPVADSRTVSRVLCERLIKLINFLVMNTWCSYSLSASLTDRQFGATYHVTTLIFESHFTNCSGSFSIVGKFIDVLITIENESVCMYVCYSFTPKWFNRFEYILVQRFMGP